MLFKAIVLTCCLLVSASEKVTKPFLVVGTQALRGEFPHQVSIQVAEFAYSRRHICGGAIINENYIITSSLCLANIDISKIYIKAGFIDHVQDNFYQLRKVSRKILHDKFPVPPQTGPHDIALLQLEKPLYFHDNIKAIALPDQDESPYKNNTAILSGWGLIDRFNPNITRFLKKIEVPVFLNQKCKRILQKWSGQYAPVLPTNVCTGPENSWTRACEGDYGGPLIQYVNGSPKLIGIASWGMAQCGTTTSVVVYTRVSSYVDWIIKNIYNNAFPESDDY